MGGAAGHLSPQLRYSLPLSLGHIHEFTLYKLLLKNPVSPLSSNSNVLSLEQR